MKEISIVGLGDMGTVMARNLLRSGVEPSGYDLRAERLAELASTGGRPAESSPQFEENSDAVPGTAAILKAGQ